MPKLSDIAGIGEKHLKKLKKANVYSIENLRQQGATPKGRAELESRSGIDKKTIHEWANRADLLRVRGVGSEYSDLLAKAGVRNVVTLAEYEPRELHQVLATKNAAFGNRVARLPGPQLVRTWVESAKMLAEGEPSGSGGGRPGGGRKG